MYNWFIQARNQGIPLSGPIITTKAVEMNKTLDGDSNFKARIGLLDKFRQVIHLSAKFLAIMH